MLQNMAKRLEGHRTLSEICTKLGISKQTALNYISALRKAGYIHRTIYTQPERTYVIGAYKGIKGKKGLVDVLNSVLPPDFQIEEACAQYVWGDYPPEKALADAVKSQKARFVLASILLFRKVKNWSLLYKCTIGHRRKIGALYELARMEFPKVPRMDGRTYAALLHSPKECTYFVKKAGPSADYASLSEKWGVFIPFTKKDIGRIR